MDKADQIENRQRDENRYRIGDFVFDRRNVEDKNCENG